MVTDPLHADKLERLVDRHKYSFVRFVTNAMIICCLILPASWIVAHWISPLREIVTDWEQGFVAPGTIVSVRGVRLANEFRRVKSWMQTIENFPSVPIPTRPEGLIRMLDSISPHPAQFRDGVQFTREGIDPWGRKLHYRLDSTDLALTEIIIWSDGPNRRDDGGYQDDIRVKLVWRTM